ncbi:hypothetical protein ONZ45_g19595 [Pleurotus djamor]|nr:hypothetical protein ONZ45_g19595 [Pleurotus djamor]
MVCAELQSLSVFPDAVPQPVFTPVPVASSAGLEVPSVDATPSPKGSGQQQGSAVNLSAQQLRSIDLANQAIPPAQRALVDARNRAVATSNVLNSDDNILSSDDDTPMFTAKEKNKGKEVARDPSPAPEKPKTFFQRLRNSEIESDEFEREFQEQIAIAVARSLEDKYRAEHRASQPGAGPSNSRPGPASPSPAPSGARPFSSLPTLTPSVPRDESEEHLAAMEDEVRRLQHAIDLARIKKESVSVSLPPSAPPSVSKSVRMDSAAKDDDGFIPVYRSKGRANANRSPSPPIVIPSASPTPKPSPAPGRFLATPSSTPAVNKAVNKSKPIRVMKTLTPISDESDSESNPEDAILPSNQIPKSSALGAFLRRARKGNPEPEDGGGPGDGGVSDASAANKNVSSPKLKPVKPTPYSGTTESGKLQRFIREVETYLKDGGIRDETSKVHHVGPFLTGKAQQFYEMLVAPSLDEWTLESLFTQLVNFCYPTNFRVSERKRLNRIYQNNDTVNVYAANLLECMNSCGGLSKRDKIIRFWMNLRESIQAELTREGLSMFTSSWDRILHRAQIIEVAQHINAPNRGSNLPSRGNRGNDRRGNGNGGGGSSGSSGNAGVVQAWTVELEPEL